MAFPIIPRKRSGSAGNPTSLQLGELAVNTLDGELYLGGDGGVMLLNGPVAAGTIPTIFNGNNSATTFAPISGYTSTNASAYLVSVGGLDQRPTIDYTITAANGGSIVFATAPALNASISIRAIQSGEGGGAGTGTVTSITAGEGLAGGTITESGTISLAAITTAQSEVGSSTLVPVLSINDKGQVTSLTTAAISGGGAPLATTAPAALATTAVVGLSSAAARADHQHIFPSAADVGALGATASAGGDLTGAYPNPTLAAITTAQSNVGSELVIPVISTDAKGRVTSLTTVACPALTTSQIAGLSTTAPAALATSAVVGLSTFAARADHQHVFPTAANVGALGATAAAGGDLAGNYPSPTLAAITTAQSAVGSATQIPVLSIDAKGRVTALSSVTAAGGGVALATTAPAALATTAVIGLSTTAARSDHQHVFPTPAQIGALSTAQISGIATTAPLGLSNSAIVGTSLFAARADHRHTFPTPGDIGALTTSQIAGLSTTAPASLAIGALAGVSTFASRSDHQHIFPTPLEIGAVAAVTGTFLIVAGGGGATGAGGGAGGMQSTTVYLTAGQVYTVTVGAGGAGAPFTGTPISGSNSSVSYTSTITSIGGGRSGIYGSPGGTTGASGGSGGGGGANGAAGAPVALGGAGTVGQGNNGGSTPGLSGSPCGGGGGGGAVGFNGSSGIGGAGGVGLQSAITGTATYYAGGGGGSTGSGSQGAGGLGGGGTAGVVNGVGGSGTANTGGGAGGAGGLSGTGGNGGSGVVILSVLTANYTGTVTGSPTVTTSGTNTIIKFTSSGTYTA